MATVASRVEKLGLTASDKRRLYGNLKVAGITKDSEVTAHTSSIIKRLANKFKSTNMVARTVASPDIGEHDKSLLAGLDPNTGDKIPKIKISKNRWALYNPETRVTYPLPVEGNAKSISDEV